MNLFIDTNVVMDMVAFRTPFAESAIRIFQMKNQGHRLLVSDLTYANIVYSARKIMERDRLYDLLINLRQYLSIVGVGEEAVDKALHLRPKDFEDALQYFAAWLAAADCIITRNKKDFSFSDIPVLTPDEFLVR